MTGFRCKEFYIAHDRCGMKVNTDSIILGSWVELTGTEQVLDIGTGSGILSLMLAQRLSKSNVNMKLTAVEIEPEAAKQAADNFSASPWAHALSVEQADICRWQNKTQFDLIISNPPYFGPGQQLDCQKRQQARLEDSLSLAELLQQAQRFAHPHSRLAIIVPAEREAHLLKAASATQWQLARKLMIQTRTGKPIQRLILEFTQQHNQLKSETLTIRDQQNHYTTPFKQLTQPFYLNF